MFDVALSNAGAQVCLVTSCDENYPPENMIDGNPSTFWTSTGLFPQEFVISFQSLMNVDSIKINCSNVKKLSIQRCVQNEPLDFEDMEERELENSGSMQQEEFSVSNITGQHLKFRIMAGHDHFVSVHKVHVDGSAVHGS